jgi:predicted phage tail protein
MECAIEFLAVKSKCFVPTTVHYYRVKALGKNGEAAFSFPTLFQLEDSIPPLSPTGLGGFIDTTGVVTLHWNNNAEEDLSGYRVFRSNFQNSEFSQVTSEPVDTAEFIERISLQNLSREMYYKVQAIDTRFNPSQYSKVIKLLKPDIVPPVAPVIKTWKADNDKLLLNWAPSSSKDVAKHAVRMRHVATNRVWTTVKTDQKNEHRFTGLQKGAYEFVIEATDSSGNKSTSKSLKVNIAGGIRKPITDIKATADRSEKKVILTWKYNDPETDKILVYRSQGEGNVSLYKSISGGSQQFVDDQLTIDTKYTYYVKVVFRNGEESGFGEKVEVKF